MPCSELMNDLHTLQLSPDAPPHWDIPTIGGMPPVPRRGHTMTLLPQHGEQGGLLVFGGLGWDLYTTRSGDGVYLNDAHIFDIRNASWSRLTPQGWCATALRCKQGC